jgi:hypothetical protein
MTIRHIVLFSFPDGRDEGFLTRVSAGLKRMAAEIPDIASATWGSDITEGRDNYDYALVLDFSDRDAYQRYRDHPAHKQFIQDFMRAVPMKKVRVQYEF